MPIPIFDRCLLVQSLAQLGRFAEAAPYEAETLRLAELTHQTYTVGMAYYTAGTLRLLKGDWARARPLIEHGVAAYRMGNLSLSLRHAVASSAWVLAQVGEASEALTRLREGEELLSVRRRRIIDQLGGLRSLGRAGCCSAGSTRRGAWATARSNILRLGYAAHALLLGDIATHPGRFDAERGGPAPQSAGAGRAAACTPLVAHCHLGLGKLYRRTGKRAGQQTPHDGSDAYREMDMRFWLEKAETELKASVK